MAGDGGSADGVVCPQCGAVVRVYRNPVPTVDVIVHVQGRGVLLIERNNPPLGWALPGGFVDYGETVEHAAVREAFEETGLRVRIRQLLGVYSDPARDARLHTMSCVFVVDVEGDASPVAGDDAGRAQFFPLEELPPLCFDHGRILQDYGNMLAAYPAE